MSSEEQDIRRACGTGAAWAGLVPDAIVSRSAAGISRRDAETSWCETARKHFIAKASIPPSGRRDLESAWLPAGVGDAAGKVEIAEVVGRGWRGCRGDLSGGNRGLVRAGRVVSRKNHQ